MGLQKSIPKEGNLVCGGQHQSFLKIAKAPHDNFRIPTLAFLFDERGNAKLKCTRWPLHHSELES